MVFIMCGNIWIDWDALLKSALRAGYVEHPTLSPIVFLLTYDFCYVEPYRTRDPHLLINLLRQFSGMGCEDSRDKLCDMLGLIAEKDRPVVDHGNTVEDVYLDAIRTIGPFSLMDASVWWSQDLPLRMGISLAPTVPLRLFSTDLFAHGPKGSKAYLYWSLQDICFEKGGSTRQSLDRWWYEYDGVWHYYDCLSPMEASTDS
jgi:hypothetical protein